ncbi:hypothetical protein TSMEX_004675 [Taenia solium]|eukprot:TsM_000232500 transcript=TsM_000232500 gene=TsM_000232500
MTTEEEECSPFLLISSAEQFVDAILAVEMDGLIEVTDGWIALPPQTLLVCKKILGMWKKK